MYDEIDDVVYEGVGFYWFICNYLSRDWVSCNFDQLFVLFFSLLDVIRDSLVCCMVSMFSCLLRILSKLWVFCWLILFGDWVVLDRDFIRVVMLWVLWWLVLLVKVSQLVFLVLFSGINRLLVKVVRCWVVVVVLFLVSVQIWVQEILLVEFGFVSVQICVWERFSNFIILGMLFIFLNRCVIIFLGLL